MQPEQTTQPWAPPPSYPAADQTWAPPPSYPAADQPTPAPQGAMLWGGQQPAYSSTETAYPPPEATPVPVAFQAPPAPPQTPVAGEPQPWMMAWSPTQTQQPWMIPFNPNQPSAPARRGPRKALIIGLGAAVGLLGFGTAGANAYAKHSICSAMRADGSLSSSSSSSSNEPPTQADITEMRKSANALRARAHLLLFNGDLRDATNGLADDVDQIADIAGSLSASKKPSARKVAQLILVAGSMNSHAREAQSACGLPTNGILSN